jgi:RNA polymerase sigma factor for flagellar operon FliA
MPRREPLTPEQQRLVRGALGLVQRIAKRVARRFRRMTAEDLVSVGQEALVEAARTFDSQRGVPFEGFAYIRVHGEMRDHAMRESAPIAQRVRRALDLGSDVFGATDDGSDADPLNDTIEEARARARVWAHDCAMAVAIAYLLGGATTDPESDLAGARERALATRTLGEVIDQLADEDASLAREHYTGGVPLAEIAARRGVSERTVQRHHRRVLEVLKRALTKRGITSLSPSG